MESGASSYDERATCDAFGPHAEYESEPYPEPDYKIMWVGEKATGFRGQIHLKQNWNLKVLTKRRFSVEFLVKEVLVGNDT